MDSFKAADLIRSTLGLDLSTPPFAIVTFALMSGPGPKQGQMGAYIHMTSGHLVAPLGFHTPIPMGEGVNPTIVASAGSNQGGAAALGSQGTQLISSASSAAGVILSPSAGLPFGATFFVYNTSATAAKIYPEVGGMLNFLATNASQTVPASTGVRARVISPTQTQLGSTVQSGTTLAVQSSSGLFAGQSVTGAGVASGATISSLPSAQAVIVSATCTLTGSGVALTFGGAFVTDQLGARG